MYEYEIEHLEPEQYAVRIDGPDGHTYYVDPEGELEELISVLQKARTEYEGLKQQK